MQEIVRVHGNWCGPDWTAGQRKPASAMIPSDYQVTCIDKLDCACRQHDIDVFERGGRTKSSDKRLINIAINMAYDRQYSRALRRKALFVAYGMLIGRSSR